MVECLPSEHECFPYPAEQKHKTTTKILKEEGELVVLMRGNPCFNG
jgi:precorrin-6B methylase 1